MTKERKPYNGGKPRAKRVEGRRAPGAGRKLESVEPVDSRSGDWVSQIEAVRRLGKDRKTVKKLSDKGEIKTKVVYFVKKKSKEDEQ